MSRQDRDFKRYASEYDPIKIGSIDGTDTKPHDRAILRALYSEYIPNKLVKGDPRRTVFVGRLHPKTTQDTIVSEFSDCGKIARCRLVRDIVTGKSKQYAFIEFELVSAVERALNKHKDYIDNTEVIVEREAERVLSGWKPRRLGGGFGGNKESGQLRFGCQERPFRRPIKIAEGQKSPPSVLPTPVGYQSLFSVANTAILHGVCPRRLTSNDFTGTEKHSGRTIVRQNLYFD